MTIHLEDERAKTGRENGSHLQDEQASAKEKPRFSEAQLAALEKALSYAKDTQAIYLKFMQKAKEKAAEPAPFPYPAYSLPANFSIPSRTPSQSQTGSVANAPVALAPAPAPLPLSPSLSNPAPAPAVSAPSAPAPAASSNILQLHNLSVLSRIYVGSIHFELGESDLRSAFQSFGPIKAVSLSMDSSTGHHKGFCFIEYETPEAAALALEMMNGSELGGRPIKVGRSNNFPPELPPGIPRPSESRLYVANVHECVTEQDMSEIFSAFGPVKSLVLMPDIMTRRHKGCGYVEYETFEPAQAAYLALRGFNLGGLELKIGRAVVGGELPPGMKSLELLSRVGSSAGGAGGSGGRGLLPAAVLNAAKNINQAIALTQGTDPEARPLPAATPKAGAAAPPSASYAVLLLTNMLLATELDAEVQAEVSEECAKYGPVVRVLARIEHYTSPSRSGQREDNSHVHFYVVFADSDSANRAIGIFNGRWFSGRRVQARQVDYQKFLEIEQEGE